MLKSMMPFIISFLIALTQKRVTLIGHWLVGSLIWCVAAYFQIYEQVYESVNDQLKAEQLLGSSQVQTHLWITYALTMAEVGVACALAAWINLRGRRQKKLEAK